MATSTYNLALILKNPLNDAEFVLLKQTPPPKFNEEEYDSYVDSDLWDLPFTKLNPVGEENSESSIAIQGLESSSEKVNLSKFDVESALIQVNYGFRTLFWDNFSSTCVAVFGVLIL